MSERLPARLEAAALVRRVEAEGGFATILKRGDADRGALTLLVLQRGQAQALLQRRLASDFSYRWSEIRHFSAADREESQKFLDSTRTNDPDSWLIELDVADAQRFIAETIVSG